MPVLSNLCAYADIDNSLLAETKTFNNMSETEGFEYPYSQYMSSVFLLRTCYDLLIQAGFKNVSKNEDEQSLTIWGLKLFFVNVLGEKNIVNIVGPGINFKHRRVQTRAHANINEEHTTYYANALTSSYNINGHIQYNHFLQYSLINDTNVFYKEGINKFGKYGQVDVSGFEGSHEFYKNVDDDGKVEYMLYVTLRCSNDGIFFSTQIYNERHEIKGGQYPLFNIFKGKDVQNNKDILVLGKKIERAPFVFSTPYTTESYVFSCRNNNEMLYTTVYQDNSLAFNVINQFCQLILSGNVDQLNKFNSSNNPSSAVTASLDSALICSGNNLIYYADDTYTQLEDTLYFDWLYNDDYTKVLKGQAVANQGKYIVYGINQIAPNLPVQSNYYYDIEEEKYWCMFNHLIPRYVELYNETEPSVWKTWSDASRFNEIVVDKGMSRFGNASFYGVQSPSLSFLNAHSNSFGKGKANVYEDSTLIDTEKRTQAMLLNPAILMRIDDEITETT